MVCVLGDAELDEGNIYEAFSKAGSTVCVIFGGLLTITVRV
ncbi:MAG: hypothetical protein CM1200mP39_26030 [Dehalococcoidia bacterium]|nr:MAG: hypothetical protein CM1200mP39_26030 [Dehalococcoidia bacterium]